MGLWKIIARVGFRSTGASTGLLRSWNFLLGEWLGYIINGMASGYLYRVSIIRRLGSNAIDAVLVALICFVTFIFLIFQALTGGSHEVDLLAAILMVAIVIAYAMMDLNIKGTPGKRACGIRIIANTTPERRARLIRLFWKWTPYFVVCCYIPMIIGMEHFVNLHSLFKEEFYILLLGLFGVWVVWNTLLIFLKKPMFHELISGASLEYWSENPVDSLAEPRGFEVIVGKKKEGR